MKKLFMLLPLAALVFASCSNEIEEKASANAEKNEAIRFTTDIQGMTRALTTMDNFTAFNVTALNSGASYFENLTVSLTSGVWGYTGGDKYWPTDNSNLDFYAYAPTSLTKVSIADGAQKITSFTQVQTVADQIDILAAKATGNKTNNASSGIAIDFKHALTQIEIRAKNSQKATYEVNVLGVKLCRISSTGAMTFPASADDYPTWGTLSNSNSFIKKGSSAVTLTDNVKSIMFDANNFLMIPQQLTAWTGSNTDESGAYLSVLCQILKKEGENWNQVFPATAGKYSFSSVPISTNWIPGHKYVYTLDFFGAAGGAGQYDPDPTNPEDPSDPQVDPTPGGNPGDPIISGVQAPLTFTVSITDWINGEGDNETLNM